jgi:hypothetical protein
MPARHKEKDTSEHTEIDVASTPEGLKRLNDVVLGYGVPV